jgi:hypothetical protein
MCVIQNKSHTKHLYNKIYRPTPYFCPRLVASNSYMLRLSTRETWVNAKHDRHRSTLHYLKYSLAYFCVELPSKYFYCRNVNQLINGWL